MLLVLAWTNNNIFEREKFKGPGLAGQKSVNLEKNFSVWKLGRVYAK